VDDLALLRSHVERCLQDIWEVCRVSKDSDGDYPFARGTASCFVRVEKGDPQLVRVFAYAVLDVRRSAKLLAELNDINARSRTVSVGWYGGTIIVEQVMHINGVRRSTLDQACEAVGSVANDIGVMLAAVFGGRTPIDSDNAELSEEAS
jgi:hypothetical protein